ncbi:MAG: extracellular solute-binding protein [Calditrichaeota bacterium]|nr:extracellular solute-binding protein [Calditrichota bacterium]
MVMHFFDGRSVRRARMVWRCRQVVYLAVCSALILSGLACTSTRQRNPNEIIYWSSNNPYEIEFARLVVAEWNRRHPDTPVRYQPVPEGQSSEEVILAAVVGKTTPDVYSNMWQGDVEAFARAGVLVPLDTLPGFLEFLYQRCDSAVVREATSEDGHIYQVPWKINPIMMVYNVGLFRAIGLDRPPATYSEYLQAAEKMKADTDGDGYVDRWIGYLNVNVTWWKRLFDFYPLYLAASEGAPLVTGNRVVFNNRYAREVFQFLRRLYAGGHLPRDPMEGRQDPFIAGQVATQFTGPWVVRYLEKFKPEGFEYRFAPVPVPDDHQGPVYTYGDPKNIVIFGTSPNPRLAWKFVRFMISKENDRLFLETTDQLPRRRNLFQDPYFQAYFEKNPRMKPFARQAQYVRGTDVCPVLKEVFDAISQQFEASVIYGVVPVDKALEEAARRVRLML